MVDHMTTMTAEQLRTQIGNVELYARTKLDQVEDVRAACFALTAVANSLGQIAAQLSALPAQRVTEGSPAEFVVRQHLKHAAGAMFVDVWKTSIERAAMDTYQTYIGDFPHQYFEVLRITHREECLAHNGQPQFVAPMAKE